MGIFRKKVQDATQLKAHENLHCSFCSKSRSEVRNLIAGPNVYICDECVDLCDDILEEEITTAETSSGKASPFAPSSVTCVLCHLPVEVGGFVAVPERGPLCAVCLDAIRAVTEDDDEAG